MGSEIRPDALPEGTAFELSGIKKRTRRNANPNRTQNNDRTRLSSSALLRSSSLLVVSSTSSLDNSGTCSIIPHFVALLDYLSTR